MGRRAWRQGRGGGEGGLMRPGQRQAREGKRDGCETAGAMGCHGAGAVSGSGRETSNHDGGGGKMHPGSTESVGWGRMATQR